MNCLLAHAAFSGGGEKRTPTNTLLTSRHRRGRSATDTSGRAGASERALEVGGLELGGEEDSSTLGWCIHTPLRLKCCCQRLVCCLRRSATN